MSFLHLKNVSFGYSQRPLFDNLSFELIPGDFLGILGPNGCGKSSFLKLMAGLLKPAQGQVLFQNEALSNYSAKERGQQLALLLQEQEGVFPFQVLEVVLMGRFPYLGRFSRESAEDVQKAKRALERVDALHLSERSITELSGGEKQRVYLARALVQESRVLFLDEPFTHLDLKHQLELCELLKDLHQKEGYTLGVVLHDLHFASKMCQRLIFLKEGKILAEGSPSELLKPEWIARLFSLPTPFNEAFY